MSVCVEGGGVSHRLLTKLIAHLALSVALSVRQTAAASGLLDFVTLKQIMTISTNGFEDVK